MLLQIVKQNLPLVIAAYHAGYFDSRINEVRDYAEAKIISLLDTKKK